MTEWLQSDVIEQDSGFMEGLSENIMCFELWHSVIESFWVDLQGLKGYEALSFPMQAAVSTGKHHLVRRIHKKHMPIRQSAIPGRQGGGTVRADSFTL